jgi:hypothetical protein
VDKQAFHADILRLVRRKANVVVPDFYKKLNRQSGEPALIRTLVHQYLLRKPG